ncbi:MAG TPA: DNA adenine methylase, partial [Anaerolineae bacterium]|nr:DNA adenine methylase [Anaerolineae bacterium]
PDHFIEPFAGGGIVSLTVAAEGLAKHVTMIEIDHQVAAVWQTIISDNGGGEWLAQRILDFRLSRDIAMEIIEATPTCTRELAFQTILRNRIYHGGILAPGSAPIRYGENGKGITSRWYPTTLSRRIREIVTIRDRITFMEGDGLGYLALHADDEKKVFFIDPPYTAGSKRAGSRLYTHFSLDHQRLFNLTAKLKGQFLITYDNDETIVRLAEKHGFAYVTIAMTNTHHAKMRELLIASDVSWVKG